MTDKVTCSHTVLNDEVTAEGSWSFTPPTMPGAYGDAEVAPGGGVDTMRDAAPAIATVPGMAKVNETPGDDRRDSELEQAVQRAWAASSDAEFLDALAFLHPLGPPVVTDIISRGAMYRSLLGSLAAGRFATFSPYVPDGTGGPWAWTVQLWGPEAGYPTVLSMLTEAGSVTFARAVTRDDASRSVGTRRARTGLGWTAHTHGQRYGDALVRDLLESIHLAACCTAE